VEDDMNEAHSVLLGDLAKALAKAQSEFGPLRKGKENPFYKSRYADLASIFDVIREPFSENGIAVTQRSGILFDDKGEPMTVLITMLIHESGQWLSSTYPVMAKKPKDGVVGPQDLGSALSYSKRYCLQAIVGLAAEDEDDDGERASGRGNGKGKEASQESRPKAQASKGDADLGFIPVEPAAASADPMAPVSMEELEARAFPEGKLGIGPVWARDRCPLVEGRTKTWFEIVRDRDGAFAGLERAIAAVVKVKGPPSLSWTIDELRGLKAVKMANLVAP